MFISISISVSAHLYLYLYLHLIYLYLYIMHTQKHRHRPSGPMRTYAWPSGTSGQGARATRMRWGVDAGWGRELGHLDFAVVGGMKISLHSPGQALAGCEPEEGGRPVCENGGRY